MSASEARDVVLILAAGRGTRLGMPKALMKADGQPWWMAQRDRLDAVGLPRLWAVSPEVRGAMSSTGVMAERTITADPGAPMFQSIIAGLVALQTAPPPAVFILPIDVPVPQPDTWHALRRDRSNPTAPSHNGRGGHPIRLPWPFIADHVLPLARDPERCASARLDRIADPFLVVIPVPDPAVTININTPDDLRRWLAR